MIEPGTNVTIRLRIKSMIKIDGKQGVVMGFDESTRTYEVKVDGFPRTVLCHGSELSETFTARTAAVTLADPTAQQKGGE